MVLVLLVGTMLAHLHLPEESSSSDKSLGDRRQPLARKLLSRLPEARTKPRNGGEGLRGLDKYSG